MAPVPGRVYTRLVDGLGVIALIVGLTVALSPPVRAGGGRDTTTVAWAWALVAVASVLILAAALAPPTPR
jgi:hypothetical protein